jgi:hypothetical protein
LRRRRKIRRIDRSEEGTLMRGRSTKTAALSALVGLAAWSAWSDGTQPLEHIVPGKSTKSDVASLFGKPWRVVQFNDCGLAMDDQADETWEYRGADPSGAFRVHIEFGDDNVVHLVAKIPDRSPGGGATRAEVAPAPSMKGMSM